MILTKGMEKKIISEIKSYKEQGYSKKRLVIELCKRFKIPVEFGMEIFEIVMTLD